jgi:hypothetical protein
MRKNGGLCLSGSSVGFINLEIPFINFPMFLLFSCLLDSLNFVVRSCIIESTVLWKRLSQLLNVTED